MEDANFLINDVFQIDRYDNLPGFSDASADVRDAILGEAANLAEEVLQPLNRVGDIEGCIRRAAGKDDRGAYARFAPKIKGQLAKHPFDWNYQSGRSQKDVVRMLEDLADELRFKDPA